MARSVQEPEVSKEKWAGGDSTVLRHPAYAQVSVHHVSGSADLYGSDFTHQNFVTIKVTRSKLHRDLSRDWHFEGEELIEVALSEAQYVTLMGAQNRQGVPCTLQRYNGEMTPGLPRRNSTRIHKQEFSAKLEKTVRELKAQKATIEAACSGLSKKMRTALLVPIETAVREIESNIPFLVESFDEHMEANIEKAKVEVSAYVTNAVTRAGLNALQAGAPLLLAPAQAEPAA